MRAPRMGRARRYTGEMTTYMVKVKKMAESIHESKKIYDKIAYLLKNMIFVCVYLRFRQLLNKVGRK